MHFESVKEKQRIQENPFLYIYIYKYIYIYIYIFIHSGKGMQGNFHCTKSNIIKVNNFILGREKMTKKQSSWELYLTE